MREPNDLCPQCSSPRIEQFDPPATVDPEADTLLVDAPEPQPDPPNARCQDCGHTWWRAPHKPPITMRQEGVPLE